VFKNSNKNIFGHIEHFILAVIKRFLDLILSENDSPFKIIFGNLLATKLFIR